MKSPMDRRSFLRSGLFGASAIAVPSWLRELGVGAPLSPQSNDNVLVVVQLSGGNDGLNTVVPYDHDVYRRMRPNLGLPKNDVLKLKDGVGLHPRLAGLRAAFEQGSLAIVEGVGYPNPNRSHFKSMDIWHSADNSDRAKVTGWLGRAAELVNTSPDPRIEINLAARPPLALTGNKVQPISFVNPAAFQFVGSESEMAAFAKITGEEESDARVDEILELVGQTASNARQASAQIRKAALEYRTSVDYPRSALGVSLKTVTALLHAGMPTRVFYVYHTGYDTHNNQDTRQGRLLGELDEALLAFQKDLTQHQHAGRVTTLVFTEFGRRVNENASRGTDHGTAGPTFVLGSRVRGGWYGKPCDLNDLDNRDLKFTTDFRSIYATLLKNWLKVDSDRVLGQPFAPLPLFSV